MYLIRNLIALIKGNLKIKNPFHFFRVRIYHNGKIFISKNVLLMDGSIIKSGKNGEIIIKENSTIGIRVRFSSSNGKILISSYCRINQESILAGNILISKHCVISPRVILISDKHSFKDKNQTILENDKKYGTKIGQINLSSNVYIGANSIILGNCDINKNVIIDANCYLSDMNIEKNSIVKNQLNLVIKDRH